MSISEEIEALVARDNQTTEHHLNVHRVDPGQLHPNRVNVEELSNSRSIYRAKAVVEDFHARLKGRSMRSLDEKPVDISDGSLPDIQAPGLLQEKGITIHKCAYDERGITEVVCSSNKFVFDNPIFIVNPNFIVQDSKGDIEEIIGEDEDGNPTVRRYKEDPTKAIIELMVQLMKE